MSKIKIGENSKLEELKSVYGNTNWIFGGIVIRLAESRTIQNTKKNFQFRGKEAGNGNASVSGLGLATMPFIT